MTKTKKNELLNSFAAHPKDSGSCSVQAALLTERINALTEHFKVHKKDHNSRRGLLQLVSRRRRLLDYLKRKDSQKYQDLISRLNLRK